MTVHDTQAPPAAGPLPAADWADHALACAAAYIHRLTSEGDLALTVAGLPGPLRLSVEPTTTLPELVERVRAARTSPVAAEAAATPAGTQVLLDAGPVAVECSATHSVPPGPWKRSSVPWRSTAGPC
ncbi:hypothetical protein AB0L17_37780, partial [Streptomyces cellulosae]